MDAGHNVNNVNTTVPAYLARSNEDPQMALDYEVAHYPPAGQANVTMWYPRGSALGGSTAMNALIHLRPHNYDLDKMAEDFNDKSWSVRLSVFVSSTGSV
jgi:choline dehydrogenase